MDPNKKKIMNLLNARLVYQFFSGILFIVLGVVIFIRGKGLAHFFNPGLFGVLFFAYGLYRIVFFVRLFRKAQNESR
jgi:uncharacterized membrane protein HdeD (DUF308 family)